MRTSGRRTSARTVDQQLDHHRARRGADGSRRRDNYTRGEVVIRDGERHLESVYKRPLSVY